MDRVRRAVSDVSGIEATAAAASPEMNSNQRTGGSPRCSNGRANAIPILDSRTTSFRLPPPNPLRLSSAPVPSAPSYTANTLASRRRRRRRLLSSRLPRAVPTSSLLSPIIFPPLSYPHKYANSQLPSLTA